MANLKVDNLERNEEMEEGRYSTLPDTGAGSENLKGKALRVRVAARERIAVRCGVLLEYASVDLLSLRTS